MYFLLIQLVLSIFFENTFAAIYGSPCISQCNFPGMICATGVCRCDINARLFWTGARCLACPTGWLFSDTVCIGYYGVKSTWQKALDTCRNAQGDLISLRDNNILPYIYKVTTGSFQRRKKRDIAADSSVAWTSAHALDLTNLGSYEWNEKSISKFDSTNKWWCRLGIADMGYYYPYNEPTRLIHGNDAENCVLFRRGVSPRQMLCLDDVFCTQEFPFVCERSESTAIKYIGPAPSSGGGGGKIPFSNSSATDANNGHQTDMSADSHESKPKKKSKATIISILIGLLLLLGIGGVLFFFMKSRNRKDTEDRANDNNQIDNLRGVNKSPPPPPFEENRTDINTDEVSTQRTSAAETGLSLDTNLGPNNLGLNIDNQKQRKQRRGAHSQQQFDEFE